MATTAIENLNLWGVVDMGSNGIRFSITDLSRPQARILPVVFQDRASISLYDAQFSDPDGRGRGSLPADIMDEVIVALLLFKCTCEDFGVPADNIHVLATEATRTAPNSEEFCSRIHKATGWEVQLLPKEAEGRIGALGVASSAACVSGLVMDLGGGSVQITWVNEKDGVVNISPKSSVSLPYGAAALKRRLHDPSTHQSDTAELKKQIIRSFQAAYQEIEVPPDLVEAAEAQGGFDLYLTGGGFRCWGYVIMNDSNVNPYPIPIINGFRASRDKFLGMNWTLESARFPGYGVYGVSKRRASQIPAVAFLVEAITEALPLIQHVQFCQGGVREGFLYGRLSPAICQEDPLVVATLPYAPLSGDAMRDLLQSAIPNGQSLTSSFRAPTSLTSSVISAIANLLFAHASMPRESRATAALHSTTTGILAKTNSLSHHDRAMLALILSERWYDELAPIDRKLRDNLQLLLTTQETWWCQYVGRVAALIGKVYPSGKIPLDSWRIKISAIWDEVLKKKGRSDVLCVRVALNATAGVSILRDSLEGAAQSIEKVGKKKNRAKITQSSGSYGPQEVCGVKVRLLFDTPASDSE